MIWLFSVLMCLKGVAGIANGVDPDQTAQGLHCLLRPICPQY